MSVRSVGGRLGRDPTSRGCSIRPAARWPGRNQFANVPAVGGLFFPQSRALGIDRTGQSPSVQKKVVYAGAHSKSFQHASSDLEQLAGLRVGAKQVERLTKRIGQERLEQRKQQLAAFEKQPLVAKDQIADPARPAPAVALVSIDGGRLQIRERDEPPRTATSHWRESKVAVLETYVSTEHSKDPDPDLPRCFLNAAHTMAVARGVGHVAAGLDAEGLADSKTRPVQTAACDQPSRPGRPQRLVRSVCASHQPAEPFGKLVHAAAWSRNFFGAARRAFLGDGQAVNWTIQKRHFPSFVPVLDFVHAMCYVFAAATAGRSAQDGWPIAMRWLQLVWAGRVAEVLPELEQRCAELGRAPADAPETDPRAVVATALRYLTNNAERMRYDEYRRLGLPITTSAVESMIKQINCRVKGSEKFWSGAGAEAILQLRADYLSETDPMTKFWSDRQTQTAGTRRYNHAA